jgi:hypothetical protein
MKCYFLVKKTSEINSCINRRTGIKSRKISLEKIFGNQQSKSSSFSFSKSSDDFSFTKKKPIFQSKMTSSSSSSVPSFSSSIDSIFKPILFDNSFFNQQQLDSRTFKPIKETIIDDVRFHCRLNVPLLFLIN